MIILAPLGMNKLPSTSCCMDNILSLGAKYNQCCPQPPQYLYWWMMSMAKKKFIQYFPSKFIILFHFYFLGGKNKCRHKPVPWEPYCSYVPAFDNIIKKYNFSHISWIIIIRIRLKINTIKYLIVYILLHLPGSL